MKNFLLKMKAVLVAMAFLISCADPGKPADNPTNPMRSMKGFEIYVYEKDNKIFYTLLPGTNREKRMEEVYNDETSVEGIDSIKAKVKDIAAGEFVALRPVGVDPSQLIELKDYLEEKEIQVTVLKQTGF